jgi:poly(beta-D-mannuronate) lyase
VQSGSLGDYTLGEYVNIGLSVRHGICTIYVNDAARAEGKLTGSSAKTCYFKTGCYNQDNNSDDGYPTESFNEVRVAAVRVQHGVEWASGGYQPIGPGVGLDGPGEPPPTLSGSKPRDLIEFNGPKQAWKINLDIDEAGDHPGRPGGSVEKSAKALAEGFVHAGHFEVVENGTAVRFRSHLNGATTGGSKNPRTELREMQPDKPGSKASWRTDESNIRRRLTARVKVTRAPRTPEHNRVSIGQIHDGDDLVQIMYDGKKKVVGYTWDDGNGNGEWQDELLVENYPLGDRWFTYRIEVEEGTVRILIDDGHGFQLRAVKTQVSRDGCYFKAGAYTQSHVGQSGAVADDFGEALFSSIAAETKQV